ncbi:hypothetical protein FACS189499_10670 [Clostridia bacterium]|nr:hypothetical protein FACS189499_10670 [Clostridia bacterium]
MTREFKTDQVMKLVGSHKKRSIPEMVTIMEPGKPAEKEAVSQSRKKILTNKKAQEAVRPENIFPAPAPAVSAVSEIPAVAAMVPEERPVFVRSALKTSAGDIQMVSVPFLLINEQLGTIMDRFSICWCDECCKEITIRALEMLPPQYVRVERKSDEDLVNELVKANRQSVIQVLTKICITAKGKNFHRTITPRADFA